MPNPKYWNKGRAEGNPTKSRKVNHLIAAVKKKECRGVGKESQADREFTDDKYIQLVDLLSNYSTNVDTRRHQAMIKFQLHLIGRGDDTCHVKHPQTKRCVKLSTYFAEGEGRYMMENNEKYQIFKEFLEREGLGEIKENT